MSTGLKLVTAALTLALAVPSAARADGFQSWVVCGGNNFSTCSSVNVDVQGTHVTMRVWNLSGIANSWAGSAIRGIGLFNLPTSVDVVPNTLTMSGPSRDPSNPAGLWVVSGNGQYIGNGIQLDLTANSAGILNSIANDCDPSLLPANVPIYQNPCGGNMTNLSNWVTFEFDVTQTWDPTGNDLWVDATNGPINPNDPQAGKSSICRTDKPDCKVIPEPLSIVLLGSGLAGLGGVAARRRRAQKNA